MSIQGPEHFTKDPENIRVDVFSVTPGQDSILEPLLPWQIHKGEETVSGARVRRTSSVRWQLRCPPFAAQRVFFLWLWVLEFRASLSKSTPRRCLTILYRHAFPLLSPWGHTPIFCNACSSSFCLSEVLYKWAVTGTVFSRQMILRFLALLIPSRLPVQSVLFLTSVLCVYASLIQLILF